MKIRAFTVKDISEVSDIFLRSFDEQGNYSKAGTERRFRHFFFDSPLAVADCPSWVAELDGRIVGFQGVQIRFCVHKAKQLRYAVLGPLCVDRAATGYGLGPKLVRTAFTMPVDFVLSDGANETGRRIMGACGALPAIALGLEWMRPVSRFGHRLDVLNRRRFSSRGFFGLVLKVATMAFAKLGRESPDREVARRLVLQDCNATEYLESVEALVLPQVELLRPTYPAGSMRWYFETLSKYSNRGRLVAKRLNAKSGRLVGCVIGLQDTFRLNLLQLVTSPGQESSVIQALEEYARDNAICTVVGRLDGTFNLELLIEGMQFRPSGGVYVYGQDSQYQAAMTQMAAGLSRLDGEWVMDLGG